jgi:Fe2+-dicitrate sensor, membrane component
MNKTQLLALAQKYLEGTATEEEKAQLHAWYDAADDEEIEMVFLHQQETQDAMSRRLFAGIQEKMQRNTRIRRIKTIRWVAAAAIAGLMLTAAGYFFANKSTTSPTIITNTPVPLKKIEDVLPGGDRARLVLADGRVILLDSLDDGVIPNDAGLRIRKENGQLIYDASGIPPDHSILHNTIITPRGGQYQVVLPDGSKVWLNAASSLHFPTAFTGDRREVAITGEAYFEVAKDKVKKFVVDVDGRSSIEVLGTHFNVMAYTDENDIRTTLLEGKVKIGAAKGNDAANKTIILQPGQQAVINQDIQVHDKINTDAVMAWKNGYFYFSNTEIQTIMRHVARWYNVDIAYEGTIGPRYFTGEIPRNMNVSHVLKILETADVHFRLESGAQPGNIKLVVLP